MRPPLIVVRTPPGTAEQHDGQVRLADQLAVGPSRQAVGGVPGHLQRVLDGLAVGPDDIYLALRGMRTLGVRLERQMKSGLEVASWLAGRPEVARVLHPALPGDPGHALWTRDMEGASGLFGFILAGWSEDDAKALVDGLQLFGIGASWGGFESLAILAKVRHIRTAVPWQAEGPLIRLHIGLEDTADLIADLDRSFAAVAARRAERGDATV